MEKLLQYLPIFIGIMTIIVNICIAIYNVGKHRIIYDIEEVRVDRTSENYLAKLKDKLNEAKYTILNVFQDNERKTTLYTLGKTGK